MTEPIKMANGSYPISDQHSAESAWKLRGHSKSYSEEQVVAHIRAACSKLGLHFPGDTRQTAASMMSSTGAHGMVYPDGLPNCAMCHMPANSPVHINPARSSSLHRTYPMLLAADKNPAKRMPVQSHPYAPMSSTLVANVRCRACGNAVDSGVHVAGMPVGMAGATGALVRAAADPGMGEVEVTRHVFAPIEGRDSTDADYKMCAKCGFAQDNNVHTSDDDADEGDKTVRLNAFVTERSEPKTPVVVPLAKAFVAQVGERIVIASHASTLDDVEQLPRELAAAWEARATGNPAYLWLEGRFVEADRANRNKAMWSSDDLEFGQPSVAYGPLNWLHSERHIVGTIADSALVQQERIAADDKSVGNHIRALAVAWPWLYPAETRAIRAASDDGNLWYSMECVSRTAACVSDGCGHSQTYREYMLQPATRCEHIRQGAAATRFAEPTFLGGAVIVPPVTPAWRAADARVMKIAASLAERQAAAFDGMNTSDAELLVATIIGGSA